MALDRGDRFAHIIVVSEVPLRIDGPCALFAHSRGVAVMFPSSMWQLLAQNAPVSIPMEDLKKYGIIAGVVLSAFLALGLLLSWLRRKKDKQQDDPEKALTENLAAYPAPPKPGKRRLLVH